MWQTQTIHLPSGLIAAYASNTHSRRGSAFSRSATAHSMASQMTARSALTRGHSGLNRYLGSTSGHSSASHAQMGMGDVQSGLIKHFPAAPQFMSVAGPERGAVRRQASEGFAPSSAPQVLFGGEGLLLLQQHAAAGSTAGSGGMAPGLLRDAWPMAQDAGQVGEPGGRSPSGAATMAWACCVGGGGLGSWNG